MNSRLLLKQSNQFANLPKLRHKSTHVKRSTDWKSAQISMQSKRKSASYFVLRPKNHKSFSSYDQKSFSKLQHSLSVHRSQFQELSNLNLSKFNQTFLKLNFNKKQLEKKKKLQKHKVFTMEKQEFLSRHNLKTRNGFLATPSVFNLDNNGQQQIYTGPLIVLDYKIEMSELKNFCYDSLFSLTRTGATLSFKDDTLYLFGGNADNPQQNLMFHKYKFNMNRWQHIVSTGQKPSLSLMYHTCTLVKDHLIFIGGVCLHRTELKKFSNPQIRLFHTVTNTWTEFYWGYELKHHIACLMGNFILIYGGTDERQRTQNAVHILNLNNPNLNYSKVNTFKSTQALSHHSAVSTVNEEVRLRHRFQIDGVIVFGGKRSNEKLSGQLMYLESFSLRLNDQDKSQIKKWVTVQIKGANPQARMCHSFDLLTGKGLCVLMGGIGQDNQYLSDMWILDLFHLSWTRICDVPLLQQTGGIAYHSSVVNDSQIYIYGGITKNQTSKQFYLIETQKYKRTLAKIQSRKRINFSTELISFKTFE